MGFVSGTGGNINPRGQMSRAEFAMVLYRLMVYDPDHPGKPKYDYQDAQHFSNRQNYPVDLIDFDELQEAAIEWSEAERERKLAERGF